MTYRIKLEIGYKDLFFEFDNIMDAAAWAHETLKAFKPKPNSEGKIEKIVLTLEFKEVEA